MRGVLLTGVVACALAACVRHVPGERHSDCKSDSDCAVGQCVQFKSGGGCEIPCSHADGKPDQRMCPGREECHGPGLACVDGHEAYCSGPSVPLCFPPEQERLGPLIPRPKTPLHGLCAMGSNGLEVATVCAEGRCSRWMEAEVGHWSCELHCTPAPYDSCPEGLECVDLTDEQLCRPKGERRTAPALK